MHAFQLLKIDHDRANQLLDQMDMADDFNEKKDILDELKQSLEAHAYIEEKFFYPLFREKDEFRELIEDSFDDHREMKSILTDLVNCNSSEEIDNRFEDLLECVEDHVDEEENELFPKVEASMSEDDLMRLGEKMEAARASFIQSEAA